MRNGTEGKCEEWPQRGDCLPRGAEAGRGGPELKKSKANKKKYERQPLTGQRWRRILPRGKNNLSLPLEVAPSLFKRKNTSGPCVSASREKTAQISTMLHKGL